LAIENLKKALDFSTFNFEHSFFGYGESLKALDFSTLKFLNIAFENLKEHLILACFIF
jgi:hypothetical protein